MRTYQVNPDGTVSILNSFSEKTLIACKRAEVPVNKRPVSKATARRLISEWVKANS